MTGLSVGDLLESIAGFDIQKDPLQFTSLLPEEGCDFTTLLQGCAIENKMDIEELVQPDSSMDWRAFEEVLPEVAEWATSEDLISPLQQSLVTLAQDVPHHEMELLLARLREVIAGSPQDLRDIFVLPPEEQSEKLAKLLLPNQNTLPHSADGVVEKPALLEEFAGIEGKIFRSTFADDLKSTQNARESKQALLAVQGESHVSEGEKGSPDGNLREELSDQKNPPFAAGNPQEKPLLVSQEVDVKSVDFQGALRAETSTPLPLSSDVKSFASVSHQVNAQLQSFLNANRFEVPSTEKITLQLQPSTLGPVEVQLEFIKGGSVKTIVMADPNTLMALKNEVQILKDGFADSGFSSTTQDFEFQERRHKGSSTSPVMHMQAQIDEVQDSPPRTLSTPIRSHEGHVNLVA